MVVERHGGRIDFVTRPGTGTTFRISLPVGARA
jgi:signal transduction histidine kinase